jgi:hypothetical protein
MPAILSTLAPLAWTGDAKTALLIPAAIIATVFLPIAYLAILLLMNSPSVLSKEDRASPLVNLCMLFAAGVATYGSVWLLSHKGTGGMIGIGALLLLSIIGIAGFYKNLRKHS